jgi:predicted membrane protein
MERQEHHFKKSQRAHLLLGIVLMFIGLFLIADIADVIPWRLRDFLFTWQALLILLGVIFISGKDGKGTGLVLILIGSFFLLPRFFDLPYYWRSLFWPSLLILLGLIVIFSSGRRGKIMGHRRSVEGEDLLDDVAVFGGGDRIINSQHFQGGKITNIFGGSKYDMTNARLAPGKNYIDVVMIFGGSKFIVPDDWDIKIEVTNIFGGMSDKRVKSIVVKDPEQTLIIRGTTLFGGGEVVNYR